MNRSSNKKEIDSYHGKSQNCDSSSDNESSSSRHGRRRSSSRTDEEDGGRSTPEDRGNGSNRKEYSNSKRRDHIKDRYRKHVRSRHVSSPSNDRRQHSRSDYKNDREKDKRSARRRSSSSSDESDHYNRRRRRRTRSRSRSRSRSRELKSKEREPKRNANGGCVQKSGDRRLFPHISDDRSSETIVQPPLQGTELTSWREGGPLPPPVFIGNEGRLAPPPPNISGRVAPNAISSKLEKNENQPKSSSNTSLAQEPSSRSSFVPPSYLVMPPAPSGNINNHGIIPPPLTMGGRPVVPPPLRPPPGAPPALGHRPPPPPVRHAIANLSSNVTSQQSSHDQSQEKIINYHEAPKAPKKLPDIKPEVKRPPPKVQSGPVKNIAIKLGATPKAKPVGVNQKLPARVASVFGADDSDSEEEMPHEAKMRMRNVGRETVTSSGPNSFGKTRQGFTDTKKLYEKNMHKLLFDEK